MLRPRSWLAALLVIVTGAGAAVGCRREKKEAPLLDPPAPSGSSSPAVSLAPLPGSRVHGPLGRSDAELAPLRESLPKLAPLHVRASAPKRGEWLVDHPESGESFEQYLNAGPITPTPVRATLVVRAIRRSRKRERSRPRHGLPRDGVVLRAAHARRDAALAPHPSPERAATVAGLRRAAPHAAHLAGAGAEAARGRDGAHCIHEQRFSGPARIGTTSSAKPTIAWASGRSRATAIRQRARRPIAWRSSAR